MGGDSKNEVAEQSDLAKTVNIIIEAGIRAGASDIHIEPREKFILVRYRIDGLLSEANRLPSRLLGPMVSHIKSISNLPESTSFAPHEGQFSADIDGQTYVARVSALPFINGEKVVMRLLNKAAKAHELEELGLWGTGLNSLKHAVAQPHGLILVSGPAGSGRSTTLHSLLSSLNSPQVNISTVEDPIKFDLAGANQHQVDVLDSASLHKGFKSLLEQDANILMVSDIRDGRAAELVTEAAVKGHLVFGAMLAKNSTASLLRLLSMGVEPHLVAAALRASVSQRLVRRLCPNCREAFKPGSNAQKQLASYFDLESKADFARLHKLESLALKSGLGSDNALSTSTEAVKHLWRASEEGCEQCGHSGFKGRLGIFEVMDNSDKLQSALVTKPTVEQISKAGLSSSTLDLKWDGLIKALRGLTSVSEVSRAIAKG